MMLLSRQVHLFRCAVFALFTILVPTQQSAVQEWVWAPELPAGAKLPAVEALDHTGTVRRFDALVGEKGLLLVMSRSFDWCPYCIRQLQQMVEATAEFAAFGVNLATMTYDPVATLAEAAVDHDVDFPLLYDADTKHVKAMGILNSQYEPGHRAYGIPYPGIFLVDRNGVIVHKYSDEDYRLRPDLDLVLEAAAAL